MEWLKRGGENIKLRNLNIIKTHLLQHGFRLTEFSKVQKMFLESFTTAAIAVLLMLQTHVRLRVCTQCFD